MSIDKKIKSIINKRTSLQLSKLHLVQLQKRLVEGYKEKRRLEKVLEKEYEDVLKLERLSIGKLFQRILGNLEQQLEIERQEYLQAVLTHKEWLKELKMMQYEKKILTERIKEIPEVEKEYQRLLDIREQGVVTDKGKNKALIKKYNKQIDGAMELKREIYEAKIIGKKIKRKLAQMIAHLQQATDDGDWTSGVYVRVKDSRANVQKAQNIFYKVKALLFNFKTELEDIYKHRKIRLHEGVDKMDEISNMYYDNLINDWVIHKNINNALLTIKLIQDRLLRTIKSLEHEERIANQNIKSFNIQKKALLLNSLK